MHPDQLTALTTTALTIGGRTYRFSELGPDALGKLQAWIKANHPNPVEAIKPHLGGLTAEDRIELLDRARRDAMSWPPAVATQAGAVALLSTQEGQEETLYQALLVHQPETTRADAKRFYRQLLKEARAHAQREDAREKLATSEGVPFVRAKYDQVIKICSAAFGFGEEDLDQADGESI